MVFACPPDDGVYALLVGDLLGLPVVLDETLARAFDEVDVEPLRVARIGVGHKHGLKVRDEPSPLSLAQPGLPLSRQDVIDLPPELTGRQRRLVQLKELRTDRVDLTLVVELYRQGEGAPQVREGVQSLLRGIGGGRAIGADRHSCNYICKFSPPHVAARCGLLSGCICFRFLRTRLRPNATGPPPTSVRLLPMCFPKRRQGSREADASERSSPTEDDRCRRSPSGRWTP